MTGRRRRDLGWWSIRVELLGGGLAGDLWPRPGRIFAVSPAHTFHAFGVAIDDAFARWDRSHLHEFTLPRLGKRVTEYRYIDDIDPGHDLDADTVTVGEVLAPGLEFESTFDLGDNWRHRCRIADDNLDLMAELGHRARPAAAVLGMGPDPRPVRAAVRDRRQPGSDPRPAHRPWPWANAPEPAIATRQGPGQYTRTVDLVPRTPDDDRDDDLDDDLDGDGA
jgi:hypothetical protein